MYEPNLALTRIFNPVAVLVGLPPFPLFGGRASNDYALFAFIVVIGTLYVLLHRSPEFNRVSVVSRTVFSTVILSGWSRNLIHSSWLVLVVQDYVAAAIAALLIIKESKAKPKRK